MSKSQDRRIDLQAPPAISTPERVYAAQKARAALTYLDSIIGGDARGDSAVDDLLQYITMLEETIKERKKAYYKAAYSAVNIPADRMPTDDE